MMECPPNIVFSKVLAVRCTAEYISSMMFIFIGCLGCMAEPKGGPVSQIQMSLLFGLATMFVVHTFAMVSGGQANPCVTLACYMRGYISLRVAFYYIVAQYVGTALGYYFIIISAPSKALKAGLCAVEPLKELNNQQIFCIEFMLTSVLLYGWCATWDRRTICTRDSISLRLGLLTTVCCLAGGTLTGGAINPARYLIPAVYHNKKANAVVYLSSQFLSGLLVPTFWQLMDQPCGLDNKGKDQDAPRICQRDDQAVNQRKQNRANQRDYESEHFISDAYDNDSDDGWDLERDVHEECFLNSRR